MTWCRISHRFEIPKFQANSSTPVFPFDHTHRIMTWRELFDRAARFETDIETIRTTLAERRDE